LKAVNVGIIGTGGIGRGHARGYRSIPGKAVIAAVADIEASRAEKAAREWGASAWFEDYRKLLRQGDVDAVDICTPHNLHAGMAVDAAEAGKHVLVEKPMALTMKDCDAIMRAARKAGVKLMVGHEQVFCPAHVHARRFIDQGYLGKLVLIKAQLTSGGATDRPREDWGWRGVLETMGGGVLIDSGVHRVYTLLYLAASQAETVFAYTERQALPIEGEDVAVAMVRFKNRAIGLLPCSWATRYVGRDYEKTEVFGTEGSLLTGGDLYFGPSDLEIMSDRLPNLVEPPARGVHPKGRSRLFFPAVDTFAEEIKHFVDCILEDREPRITGEDGKATVEVILGAYASAKTGKPAKLPLQE